MLTALFSAVALAASPRPSLAANTPRALQLDVIINGIPAGLIGSFSITPNGMIGATRAELESLSLRVAGTHGDSDLVMLNEIPSLKYQYEERSQRIRITVDDAWRLTHVYDLRPQSDANLARPAAGWGMVLNYDLFSVFNSPAEAKLFGFGGTSLTLDSRAFSPFGTLAQSAILGVDADRHTNAIRLDSSFRHSDPDRLITWTAGDAISGGLTWSRPIRIGGLQAQSNFSLRPDLVTMPLPNLGGTAAVPSTVDVFVNNARTFSQEIGAGPFALNNIPLVTGAGNAQVVVRDSSGHETVTNLPFFGSAALLAPGLDSWSVEAGLPRISYGSAGDTYLADPVGSASVRRGIRDWLTVESHVEGGSSVVNFGVGAAARTGAVGVATAAVAGSRMGRRKGGQVAVSYETTIFGISVTVATQRTIGRYADLGSATARRQAGLSAPFTGLAGVPAVLSQTIYANADPPPAVDRISIGGPFPFDPKASWGISFVHLQDAADNVSKLLSLSVTRALPFDVALYATAFRDFGTSGSTGALIGLTIPLGRSISVSSSLSAGTAGGTGSMEVSHALGAEPGSIGWRMRETEGVTPYRDGSIAYRSQIMTTELGLNQSGSGNGGTLDVAGGIAAMGGGVFLSNRITDAFAVVDAGAPGVDVSNENRLVGTSNARGLLLVPTLRSYQKNRLSIDPSNLPVDAEVEATREVVTPSDRAGILVSFKMHSDTTAAVVIFIRPDGAYVPAGSGGRLIGGEEFIVGYDGESFIKGLAASNSVTIDLGDTLCHATFGFEPRPGEQVHIGPVKCK